jgi:hypothetical protein
MGALRSAMLMGAVSYWPDDIQAKLISQLQGTADTRPHESIQTFIR